jgi:hypothetical protein
MNDQMFLSAFENGILHDFPHRAHIRMAWLYLRAYGLELGTQRIREGIQRLARQHGATQKYHETITVFWALLVHHTIMDNLSSADFETFVKSYPILLNSQAIYRHYSHDRLWSDAARREWVEPDVLPLPASSNPHETLI